MSSSIEKAESGMNRVLDALGREFEHPEDMLHAVADALAERDAFKWAFEEEHVDLMLQPNGVYAVQDRKACMDGSAEHPTFVYRKELGEAVRLLRAAREEAKAQ